MKKCLWILILMAVLCGCGQAATFETLGQPELQPAMQPQGEIFLELSAAERLESSAGTLYLCDGYEVTVEVLAAGDLNATLEALTGFGTDELTVLETSASDCSRFESVWTAAGEGGDTVGRILVLDDGCYHYCVTATAPAAVAAALRENWQTLFGSVRLS